MDGIVASIDHLSNWFGILLNNITFFSRNIIDIFFYIISILKTLFYGLTSLLTGIGSLIFDVFDGGLFYELSNVLTNLTAFIGSPAVVFLSSLLMIVIVRIVISFVFRIFRLNLDYKKVKKS